MKRLIAAAILLFIVIGVTTANFIITEHHFKVMTALVRESRDLYEKGEKEAAAEKAAAANAHWEKSEKLLAVFINRGVIDEIGEAVTRQNTLAKGDDRALVLAETDVCLMLIEHMHDVEQIMIY